MGKYRKLVVGGRREEGRPKPGSGDLYLDITPTASPHVIGDIFRPPFKHGSFEHVLYERFSWCDILDNQPNGIAVAYDLLKPGGKLAVLTGLAPLGNLIPLVIACGFQIESLHIESSSKGELVWCHGEWMRPGGVYLSAIKEP